MMEETIFNPGTCTQGSTNFSFRELRVRLRKLEEERVDLYNARAELEASGSERGRRGGDDQRHQLTFLHSSQGYGPVCDLNILIVNQT